MSIKLANVRLAFADIFTATDFNNDGKFAYKATLLLEPGSENEAKVRKAIVEAAKVQWHDKAKAELSAIEKKDRTCLHDGSDKDYDGFDGLLYVSASNKQRPTIVDKRGLAIIDESGDTVDRQGKPAGPAKGGVPYSGCYAHASIEIWAQDNKWGKRINASLGGIMFHKDGEAFAGGKATSVEEFDEFVEEDSDEPEADDDNYADLF